MQKTATRQKEIETLSSALQSWEYGVACLGECIVAFQRIEDGLSICISGMIGKSQKIGEIVTSELSFHARVSVFAALFLHMRQMSTLPSDVGELIKRLNWASERRNTLVHSIWDASETRPDAIRRSKKAVRVNGLKAISEHVSPDELSELSRLFEGIVTDLFWLTAMHFPKASLQRYRKSKHPDNYNIKDVML